MKIGASSKRAQLQKRDALETETDDRILFRVARTLVPETTIRFQHVGVFVSETIKTRAAKPVFTFDNETQRHRKFAERLLIRFNCCQSRDQIAFAVRRATRVQLSIADLRRKRSGAPVRQMSDRLHVVVTVNDER